jgi:hypothetical protein
VTATTAGSGYYRLCLASVLARQLSDTGNGKGTSVSVMGPAMPAGGMAGARYGVEVDLAPGLTGPRRVWFDISVLQRDRAVVTVVVQSEGSPFPSGEAEALVGVLAARLRSLPAPA